MPPNYSVVAITTSRLRGYRWKGKDFFKIGSFAREVATVNKTSLLVCCMCENDKPILFYNEFGVYTDSIESKKDAVELVLKTIKYSNWAYDGNV